MCAVMDTAHCGKRERPLEIGIFTYSGRDTLETHPTPRQDKTVMFGTENTIQKTEIINKEGNKFSRSQ